jgi:glycosyltransferase involved in cell wall biosynthesis
MEAGFVTGPAKNLLEFARRARLPLGALAPVDLSIVAYRRGAESESAFIQAARQANLTVDVVHERGRFDRSAIAQLRRVVARRDPQIVQTHNVKSHCFLRLSGIWRERIWLAFQHGYTAPDFKMLCYNQVDRWSLRAARHVVTVCGPFGKELAGRGIAPERISVLHNSVEPLELPGVDEVRRLRAGWNIPGDRAVLASIGRLSREKGHIDLIAAAAKLKQRGVNFHVLIVGEGPERRRIEEARKRWNLGDAVTLTGLAHDVRPYLALADIVVLASHSEGSPNVLLEAMSAAKPVAATRVGGIPEIALDQETALLVAARDPSALAAALERLISDAGLRERLGRRGREVALTDFSPDAYRRRLGELYARLLSPSPESPHGNSR